MFSGLWSTLWLPAIIAATHILIDGIKAKYNNNLRSLVVDQFCHLAVILVIWLWVIDLKSQYMEGLEQMFLPGIKIWVIIAAYIIIIWPSGILINKLTEKLRMDIFEKEIEKDITVEKLERAGTWIGWLERILILTFVLLKQYEVIGLLVAVKTFRFSGPRKLKEYVLIGTLLSFVIAVIVGLAAGVLLGLW